METGVGERRPGEYPPYLSHILSHFTQSQVCIAHTPSLRRELLIYTLSSSSTRRRRRVKKNSTLTTRALVRIILDAPLYTDHTPGYTVVVLLMFFRYEYISLFSGASESGCESSVQSRRHTAPTAGENWSL